MSVRDLIIVGAGPSGLSAASPQNSATSTIRCSSRACWSTPFFVSRPRWCFSPRPSCSKSAGCRSCRRTTNRRASRRCAITARSSTNTICRSRIDETVLSVELDEDEEPAVRASRRARAKVSGACGWRHVHFRDRLLRSSESDWRAGRRSGPRPPLSIANRTRISVSASSSSAAGIQRPKRRSSCIAPAPT